MVWKNAANAALREDGITVSEIDELREAAWSSMRQRDVRQSTAGKAPKLVEAAPVLLAKGELLPGRHEPLAGTMSLTAQLANIGVVAAGSEDDKPVRGEWSKRATDALVESWGNKFLQQNRGNLTDLHWKGESNFWASIPSSRLGSSSATSPQLGIGGEMSVIYPATAAGVHNNHLEKLQVFLEFGAGTSHPVSPSCLPLPGGL